jgi:hypothetical protein
MSSLPIFSKREPVRISRDVRLRSAYSDHEKETSAVLDPNSDSGDLFRAIQAYMNLDQINYIRFHELIDRQ